MYHILNFNEHMDKAIYIVLCFRAYVRNKQYYFLNNYMNAYVFTMKYIPIYSPTTYITAYILCEMKATHFDHTNAEQ